MSEIKFVISPESLVSEILPGVEAEIRAEGMAAPVRSPEQREALVRVAVATNQGKPVSPEQLQAAGISSENLDKLASQVTQIHESLGERIKDLLHHGEGRVEEIAKLVSERAEMLGVSTVHYMEKLQKSLLQYTISTFLLDPIPVHLSTGPSTLGAATVNLTTTITVQPTVTAGADVVQGFIASLFDLSFELQVGYGAVSSS
jgi:hypothetical protein